jgi:hypothetical protein
VEYRPPGPDQLLTDLFRKREVGQAVFVVMDVAELPAAEPVDGGRGDPEPVSGPAAAPRLLAHAGPGEHLALDLCQQHVVHIFLLSMHVYFAAQEAAVHRANGRISDLYGGTGEAEG